MHSDGEVYNNMTFWLCFSICSSSSLTATLGLYSTQVFILISI